MASVSYSDVAYPFCSGPPPPPATCAATRDRAFVGAKNLNNVATNSPVPSLHRVTLLVLLCSSACGAQPVEEPPTPLPIQLEQLTDAQQAYIRQLHETDRSTYLVDTRPVLFQIQGVGDSEDQRRGPVTFDRPVTIMIYCLGESKDGHLVDYGWITNATTKQTVWKMRLANTTRGGTAEHTRKQVETIQLPAGSYTLNYHSDVSHSRSGWIGGEAERPFYYGITAFNLEAISRIRAKLKEAGMPLSDS